MGLRRAPHERRDLTSPRFFPFTARAGTFGKLVDNQGFKETMFEMKNIKVNLECTQKNLFYRQCVSECTPPQPG